MKKQQLPLSPIQIIPVILVASLCLLFALLPNSIIDAMEYSRFDINEGEWWRLITGHFAHTNANHLIVNLGGLLLLWALHGDYYSPYRFLIIFLCCGLGIGLLLFYTTPTMLYYVGLSGILHGLFVWGSLKDIQAKRLSGYLLILGIVIKLAYEQINGPDDAMGQWINATVAVDAHLFGALCALLAFALTEIKLKTKKVR